MVDLTIGVLALQGAFIEHIRLLKLAADDLSRKESHFELTCIEVRTRNELSRCDALIIPGGESTSISLIAQRNGLLEPLRAFVKLQRKPVWGTCAGLILLAEAADRTKATGQELIGGLDVKVQRNYFGRQVDSFEADLVLPFLQDDLTFHSVFIRAPVVENILTPQPQQGQQDRLTDSDVIDPPSRPTVEVLERLPGRARAMQDRTMTAAELGEEGDIIAVKQGSVFGTAFHPELTGDRRIHTWWLQEILSSKFPRGSDV